MTKIYSLPAGSVGGSLGAVLLAMMTGCVAEVSSPRGGYRDGPAVQTTVVLEDDYVYYPGYEMYYSSRRHEYVYRDGNAWVRRPEPRGVTVNVLLAAPSVRMDFHDSPELHNSAVVKSYPKTWSQPGKAREAKDDRRAAPVESRPVAKAEVRPAPQVEERREVKTEERRVEQPENRPAPKVEERQGGKGDDRRNDKKDDGKDDKKDDKNDKQDDKRDRKDDERS